MGVVKNLFDERWVENVFAETCDQGALRVDISTKGRVRFITANDVVDPPQFTAAILSMEQVSRLGELIAVAFTRNDEGKEDDNGNGDKSA